jgi:glycosyltransferase involved in cell wall biosynthesis
MPRLALVHDWLTGMRGGEKCLDRMCRMFPDAPLATLFHSRGQLVPTIENRLVQTSWLQHLPGWQHYYRYLLPLFPSAARWTIPKCDLVVSLSHCIAKAAKPPAGVPHVCYCFTPMRYAWHMKDQYFGASRTPAAWLRDEMLTRLRDWDRRTSNRVTHFVAISQTVRRRIRDCYDRDSVVVYPPVDVDFYSPAPLPREDYYLVVSAFAPYKRIDIAVTACSQLGRQLIVIGTGQDAKRLRAIAGPTVQFLGWQADEAIRDHFRKCRALLFPGEEDFGIVPVEAQACGAPVIAFGRGGATETVRRDTGLLFEDQTVNGMIETIEQFESRGSNFDAAAARRWAETFSTQRFDSEINSYIQGVLGEALPLSRAA